MAYDRYFEEAHRALMHCYAGQGERSQALGCYCDLVELRGKELGFSPAPETAGLYARLRQGEDA